MAYLLGNIWLLPMLLLTVLWCQVDGEGLEKLKRQKREWLIPPRVLKENRDYRGQVIAKIRSDEESRTTIRYSLEGKGADKDPIGLFTVNSENGDVYVTQILDREKEPMYILSGVAKFQNGTRAEKDIELRVRVQDENDCTPRFNFTPNGAVNESSPKATYIMTIMAVDDDEPNSLNAKIAYSIVQQKPPGEAMFYINSMTGQIYVRLPTLDRETQESYNLTIKASDLDGAPNGYTTTATIVIMILDINDNVPTLENEMYEGSVEENRANVEVMRIKALDKDQVNTENWLAVFTIDSGNEAGYFSITTDPKTNEGIITVTKPLDYEELRELGLKISVSNKAEYHQSIRETVQKKTYPVKIAVKNVPEGPIFKPVLKFVNVSEGTRTLLHTVITKHMAIDGDTFEIAKNVRYLKGWDPDNWLTIHEKTAEIRLNKLPDRESAFLKNGTYYTEILCITNDVPSKTSTGTIALIVEDTNDHCPVLVQTPRTMCVDRNVVFVTAVDNDPPPNGQPLEFRIVPGSTKEAVVLERINDTTAVLRSHGFPWPGPHQVALDIRDQQGKACGQAQVVNFNVCTCTEEGECINRRETSRAVFGAPGVGLLLLGLLLLLLVPLLLLFCACSSKGHFLEIPYDSAAPLSLGNTERIGEDKDIPLLHPVIELDYAQGPVKKETVTGYGAGHGAEFGVGHGGGYGVGFGTAFESGSNYGITTGVKNYNHLHEEALTEEALWRRKFGNKTVSGSGGAFQGMALPDEFLDQYYSQKASFAHQEFDSRKEGLTIYDYEGSASPAGSVGCCSLLEVDNDLDFLNHLDSKFKTLAEICMGKAIEQEVSLPRPKPADLPRPSPSPSPVTTQKGFDVAATNIEVAKSGTVHTSNSSSSAILEERVMAMGGMQHLGATQQAVVVPTPAYVLQPQPMYIATAPMLQTARYLVDPCGQDAGLQGVYVLADAVQSDGVLVEGKRVLPGPLAHSTLSKATNVALQEQKTSPGQVVRGEAVRLTQSPSLAAGTSTSQKVVVMERNVGAPVQANGSLLNRNGSRQVVSFSGSSDRLLAECDGVLLEARQGVALHGNAAMESRGTTSVQLASQGEATGWKGSSGTHKVVIQEKVSVTGRSVQGNVSG